MSQLQTALQSLLDHPGVEHVLVLGRDGLLIQHVGEALDADTVSAMVPGVASAAAELGGAAGLGGARTVAVELDEGVALVAGLSPEVLLAVLVRGDVGFAPLLRALHQDRPSLAALV